MQSSDSRSLLNIESEIAPLQKVLIHTPGPEIECMAPDEIDKYLFNNVIFLKDISKEYRIFKSVLSSFSKVYEIKQCLEEVLDKTEAREFCLNKILIYFKKQEFKKELLDFESSKLVNIFIEGYKKSKHEEYLLKPLPNLYFTRDISIVVGNKYIISHMAHKVRFTESVLSETIFKFHPDFQSQGQLFNTVQKKSSLSLEGGDVHIWDRDLYLIGLSLRTNKAAIDSFINALIHERNADSNNPFHILVVSLPHAPSMIHLDMVFTRLTDEQVLAYGPAVSGQKAFPVQVVSVDKKGTRKDKNFSNLISALKEVGKRVEPIFIGGEFLVNQKRAQWMSGANSFAVSPGKVICYENDYTLRELEKSGFTIMDGKNFLDRKILPSDLPEKVIVSINGSQLSQGGGGPRCMTCPLSRSD